MAVLLLIRKRKQVNQAVFFAADALQFDEVLPMYHLTPCGRGLLLPASIGKDLDRLLSLKALSKLLIETSLSDMLLRYPQTAC